MTRARFVTGSFSKGNSMKWHLLLAVCSLVVAGAFAKAEKHPTDQKRADSPRVKVEFRRAESIPAPGLEEVTVPGTTKKVYLHKQAALTDQDIAEARPTQDVRLEPAVDVRFTREGREKMAKLSEQQLGKPLAILVNGKLVCAPLVKAKISERALITGRFTEAEAESIARAINGK
jgi:preprotein translocase subunit SecD